MCSIRFFFENNSLYEIIWKYIVEGGRPQMTIWRMRIACWIPVATKYTVRLCNVYFFSTATMVERTLLNITLGLYCLSCIEWRCQQLRLRWMSGDEWVMSKQLFWSFFFWILIRFNLKSQLSRYSSSFEMEDTFKDKDRLL